MRTLKVTLRGHFCPDVHFETTSFDKVRVDRDKARVDRIENVLGSLRDITGLNWTVVKDTSDEDGNKDYECFIIHPGIASMADRLVHWARPTN